MIENHIHSSKRLLFETGRLRHTNEILLPDEWSEIIDESTITVHLTPIGADQTIIAKSVRGDRIIVQSKSVFPIDCFYMVTGERLDVPEE